MASSNVGPFKGLIPITEHDSQRFFGREKATQQLRALLMPQAQDPYATEHKVVLVSGQSGSGKTSFLQTKGISIARSVGLLPLYLEIQEGWENILRSKISHHLGAGLSPNDSTVAGIHGLYQQSQIQTLLIFDQLEALLWLDEIQQRRLADVLLQRDPKSSQLLLGVNQSQLHVLGKVFKRGRIPDSCRISLPALTKEDVAQHIEQSVLAGSGYMEASLPALIAQELCDQSSVGNSKQAIVQPVDYQCVCHAAYNEGALTYKKYLRAGGTSVLRTLYVERLAQRAGGLRKTQAALALISEQENSHALLSLKAIAESAGLEESQTNETLESLVRVGLLRKAEISGAEPRFGLVHPYLAQSLKEFIAPLRKGRAEARLALQRCVGTKSLLRPKELATIRRYIGKQSLNAQQRAKLGFSTKVWFGLLMILLSLPFLLYFSIYYKLATTQYLSFEQDRTKTSRVVLRQGDPTFSFANSITSSRFGSVSIDTGIAISSLSKNEAQAIRDEDYSGKLFKESNGIPRWLKIVTKSLSTDRRGLLLALAGKSELGEQELLKAKKGKICLRSAKRLLLIGKHSSAEKALLHCLADKNASIRRQALNIAGHLPAQYAKSVFFEALKDHDALVRYATLDGISILEPEMQMRAIEKLLLDSDDRVQRAAFSQLEAKEKTDPLMCFVSINSILSQKKERTRPIRRSLLKLQQKIISFDEKALANYLINRLKNEDNPALSISYLKVLIELSDHLKREITSPILTPLLKHEDVQIRALSIALSARFSDPAQAVEELHVLARKRRSRNEATFMRRAAALGLGLIDGEREKRLKILKRLIVDRDKKVKRAAISSLLKLGTPGISEVTNLIQRGFIDISRGALDVVCHDLKPDRQAITQILSISWNVRGGMFRKKALGCAKALAGTHFRMSMWLADQATVLQDSKMREAAAPAVALALAKKGKGLERLARFYLNDKDESVRKAVLEAIDNHPAETRAEYLFKYIEKLVDDPSIHVQAAAAPLCLSTAPSLSVGLKSLIKLLKSDKALVRRAAIKTLLEVDQKMFIKQRKMLRKGLGRLLAQVVSLSDGQDAIVALKVAARLKLHRVQRRAATHREAVVRAAAISNIRQLKDKITLRKILEPAQRDREKSIRFAAIEMLAKQSKLLAKDAVHLLMRSIDAPSNEERWQTYNALGSVKGAVAQNEAVAFLAKKAQARSETTRKMAVHALGKLCPVIDTSKELLIASADRAYDVRFEAFSALAKYYARNWSVKELWKALLDSEKNAVQRGIMTAALAEYGRLSKKKAKKLVEHQPRKKVSVAMKMAMNFALYLSKVDDDPVELISELYGW